MRLCSFLMPTRSGSFTMLAKAVLSILSSGDARDMEILLRVDDDDKGRIAFATELVGHMGKVVVGPRGKGYNDMGVFVDDLLRVADSQWCWLFDDDAFVIGDWYGQLSKIHCDPVKGPAVNAEYYVLGESYYKNGTNPPGTIMPTEFCKTLQHRCPVDQQWIDEVTQRYWEVRHMPGVYYHHDGRRRV